MNLTNKDIKHVAKKLDIANGDILLIKAGTWLAKRDRIDALGEYLQKTARVLCLIIVVQDLDNVEKLNEPAMNKHGWYKIRSEN